MAKPSRWNAEKRYQIVKEALSQKEPMGQIGRRHQVDGGKGSQSEKAALERPIEELQKLIGEQAIEIGFLKRLSRS